MCADTNTRLLCFPQSLHIISLQGLWLFRDNLLDHTRRRVHLCQGAFLSSMKTVVTKRIVKTQDAVHSNPCKWKWQNQFVYVAPEITPFQILNSISKLNFNRWPFSHFPNEKTIPYVRFISFRFLDLDYIWYPDIRVFIHKTISIIKEISWGKFIGKWKKKSTRS